MVAIVDNKGTITTKEEDAKTLSDIQATKKWYTDNAYILGRTGDTGSNFYTSIVNQLKIITLRVRRKLNGIRNRNIYIGLK